MQSIYMKHVTVIFPGEQSDFSTIACIAGAFEIFQTANAYRKMMGEDALFTVELAGTTEQQGSYGDTFTVKPKVHLSAIKKTDLIIIPSAVPGRQKADKANDMLIEWIKKQYKEGAEIASMCSGAFILASSGLLDGKNCSTHWSHVDAFKQKYPQVKIQADLLITDENGIYTNGGAYSFLNLMIYLVEKYYGRATAIYCSKIFQIEMDRQSQSAFIIFKGQKMHGDEMVKEAQTYLETQLHEKVNVEELSSRFAVGRRNFDRRFIKATGNTPIEYLQRVKIESAKRAFETSRKTVNEVMYDVGYSDVKAFRDVFKKITGMSPITYRERYQKHI